MSGLTSRSSGYRRHETIAEWMARTDAEYAVRSARPHFVYRAFDEFGMLLYIGCTVDVERRLVGHRSSSQWHRYMASHTVEGPYPSMASGRAAEREAIDNEAAFFNASQADIRRTQANRNAARRMLHDAGIYQPTSHHLERDDIAEGNPAWESYCAESDAWGQLCEELRAELKATTHPYLTDEDRLARYLLARNGDVAA